MRVLPVLLVCGCLGQEAFAERYADGWCVLAVSCPLDEPPGDWDLSSVDACRADVSAFVAGIEDESCPYDRQEARIVLEQVEVASCADYAADPQHLTFSTVFACERVY